MNPLKEKLSDIDVVLGTKSPRRHQLLKALDIPFTIITKEVEETYPDELENEEIPIYLAELKAAAFDGKLADKQLLITCDTVVFLHGELIGKPKNEEDAKAMLNKLSDDTHVVISGVCLKSKGKQHSFYEKTRVHFNPLFPHEIDYYINQYHPLDKAGSYGIQEWIGYIGVNKIEGCYYNVMGLPLQRLYKELLKF